MTHLIIHQSESVREQTLLNQISLYLQKSFLDLAKLQQNPDIHLIKSKDGKQIGIAEIKQLQREMVYKPFQELYQIGVILNADALTVEAQNALLKTLEEQSAQTIYFLTVGNEKSLLETVVSRSVKIYGDKVSTKNGTVENKQADSREVDEDKSENERETEISKLVSQPLYERFLMVEQIVDADKEDKVSVKLFLEKLTAYYRKLLTDSLRSGQLAKSKEYSKLLEEIEKSETRIISNVNKRLALENVVMEMGEEFN